MSQPTFSLVYTSVRPECIPVVISDWLTKATNKAVEIILAVDAGDNASIAAAEAVAASLKDSATVFKYVIQDDMPGNCVKGWNLAAEQVTGEVLVQVTDDFVPPTAWDDRLCELQPTGWIDQDWAVHVNDGYVRDLMTLAIITKVRYDRFGYFFYPDYESLFSDTELTAVAYKEKRVLNAMHLNFEHKHPDCGKRVRDKVDLVHASKERWTRGETLFNHRRNQGFPIDIGPMAGKAESVPDTLKFCCYIQATKNDFCLDEVCQRMREEGVQDFFFSVPDEYWSGRKTPQEDIDSVIAVSTKLNGLGDGTTARVKIHPVREYRFPGDSRIRVETRVRNDALAWMRSFDFEHILIVDGDELWKRGTLHYIKELVSTRQPTAISSLMVPVVGLPGYPIDGASDVAVVYIGNGAQFKECRTPVGEQFRLQMPLVIHFTGCRRTMEEIVSKHKESGHYDDPDYDFDTFLEKVLPNIRPGYSHNWGAHQGIHFYRKYQIWPTVRNWWGQELAELPATLLPYLGTA